MKFKILSVSTLLFVLCNADCSVQTFKSSSRSANLRLKPITQKIEENHLVYEIKSSNLRDGRSFADVIKGVKKTDNSNEKKETKEKKKLKKEKKSKIGYYRLLQPKLNFEQNAYDFRKVQYNETIGNHKKDQYTKNRGNKKHQSAHKGKLYNAR